MNADISFFPSLFFNVEIDARERIQARVSVRVGVRICLCLCLCWKTIECRAEDLKAAHELAKSTLRVIVR